MGYPNLLEAGLVGDHGGPESLQLHEAGLTFDPTGPETLGVTDVGLVVDPVWPDALSLTDAGLVADPAGPDLVVLTEAGFIINDGAAPPDMLQGSPDPTIRLRHGAYFDGGIKQPFQHGSIGPWHG